MARRLEAHEPIQYVTGQAEFLRRTFAVDRRALIPRPETEHLVMDALSDPALSAIPAPRIADVGTGSGVLAVSLALARPDARVTAVDISADALELARENARRFSVEGRIAWRRHALLDGLAAGTLDAVVANLPYVPTPEIETLEARIRDHEPRVALEGGPDGLRLITRLLPQAARVLRPGGLLLLEIGDGQGPAVRDALEAGPFTAIHIRPDAAGHDRIARAVRTAIDEPVPPQ